MTSWGDHLLVLLGKKDPLEITWGSNCISFMPVTSNLLFPSKGIHEIEHLFVCFGQLYFLFEGLNFYTFAHFYFLLFFLQNFIKCIIRTLILWALCICYKYFSQDKVFFLLLLIVSFTVIYFYSYFGSSKCYSFHFFRVSYLISEKVPKIWNIQSTKVFS